MRVPRGRPRCATLCSSTGCGWRGRFAPPMGAMSYRVGVRTHSSRVRLSPDMTRSYHCQCVCMRRRQSWNVPDSSPSLRSRRGRTSTSSSPPIGRRGRTGRCSPGLGGAGIARLARRPAIDRSDQPASKPASTDQEPAAIGARRSLRHCAFRRCRGTRHHRHHPYWRPASWAAGVAVVDALSWGDADDGLIERWATLPEWPQMLLRALIFRLAVHALHPRSSAQSFPGLARTAALVRLTL